jgi:CHASE3 domain sensor protein
VQERFSRGPTYINTINKKDRLAGRLTRGSQPARRRVQGKRFTTDDQPKQRERPKGATNLVTRELEEAILARRHSTTAAWKVVEHNRLHRLAEAALDRGQGQARQYQQTR